MPTYLAGAAGAASGSTAWTYWADTTATATTATTDVVWRGWAATSGSVTANIVWHEWAGQTTNDYHVTTAGTSAGETWVQWTRDSASGVITMRPHVAVPVPALTPEQIAAYNAEQAQRQADYARIAKEAAEKKVKAQKRAEQLLLTHLTHEQEKAWKENKVLFITGQSGKRYKIRHGVAHNIWEVDEHGNHVKEFCVHIDHYGCPVEDNVLAQILGLRFNERATLRKANVWRCTRNGNVLIERAA